LGVIDADLQHPPDLILKMLRIFDSNPEKDIVIASRRIKGSQAYGLTPYRQLVSSLGTFLTRIFLLNAVKGICDPLSGFFILRKEVILGVSLKPLGYKILLEVLVRGKYNAVLEIPYVFRSRKGGKSKVGPKQYLLYLYHLIKLRFFRIRDKGV